MPRYEGDIELINHTAGSLTSQAYHKRWVIKNEFLADKAEKTLAIAPAAPDSYAALTPRRYKVGRSLVPGGEIAPVRHPNAASKGAT